MSKKPSVVSFKLFPGQDDDLIAFFKSLGTREKSSYIRMAIRQQFTSNVKQLQNNYSSRPLPKFAKELNCKQAGNAEGFSKSDAFAEDDLEARLDQW
jgi:hypothetical protein